MLIPVLPSQITDYWPTFEGHIEQSLPPLADGDRTDANQILYSLMVGSAQCWLFTNKEQELKGFVITATNKDISDVRTLILYCVVIFDKTASVEWAEELETLKKFALTRECSKIAAYVANEKVIKCLQDWGVSTSFIYATLDV